MAALHRLQAGAAGSQLLVTTINASAIRLLGVSPGSWIGAKLSEMLRGAPLAVLEQLLGQLRAERREILRRQAAITVSGSVLPERLRLANPTSRVSNSRPSECLRSTAPRTSSVAAVISGPMPSPGSTRIFNGTEWRTRR